MIPVCWYYGRRSRCFYCSKTATPGTLAHSRRSSQHRKWDHIIVLVATMKHCHLQSLSSSSSFGLTSVFPCLSGLDLLFYSSDFKCFNLSDKLQVCIMFLNTRTKSLRNETSDKTYSAVQLGFKLSITGLEYWFKIWFTLSISCVEMFGTLSCILIVLLEL